MLPLLLIGAGGFGREVVEAVRAINQQAPTWELLGFLDDGFEMQGSTVDGTPVVGTTGAIERFPQAQVVVCTGSPSNYFSRKRLVTRLGLPSSRYATLIHPSAIMPASVDLGPGSVLLATVVVTARIRLGAHVAVMPGVVLTHDDVVGDYVTMGAGARLAGGVTIGEGAYIGAGAMVREKLSVGPWALLGMGAVVLTNVPEAEVWAGVPARVLRKVTVPEDIASR
jgi:sugar O-acyltransferase (sialic acid O-acetyltransferase NeuD family)